MNSIKKLKSIIVITFLLTCVNTYIEAADIPKWYDNREEAFAIAKEENKYIFLVYGRSTCGVCNTVKGYINEPPISDIVNKSFILWYCDINIQGKMEEARVYRDNYDGTISIPLLCVIDPLDSVPALSYSIGYRTSSKIQEILNSHMPTSNEDLADISNKVYITNNTLTISNESVNEHIYVYTINGRLIDSFDKKDHEIIRSAGSYPEGILLIKSSQGWNLKISNYVNQ